MAPVIESEESTGSLYQALKQQARQSNQRRLLVLSGTREWGVQRALSFIQSDNDDGQALWISDQELKDQKTLSGKACLFQLGSESSHIIFDSYAGFNANTISAISGTLMGGGVFVLITPPLQEWPAFADADYQRFLSYPCQAADQQSLFLQRVAQNLVSSSETLVIQQGQDLPVLPEGSLYPADPPKELTDNEARTADQQQAIEAILHVVDGHRKRPLVLKADRGRGKSAALGVAAGKLLQRDRFSMVVTAPTVKAVQFVLEHALQHRPGAELKNQTVTFGDSQLQFVPPDELLRGSYQADLLLVDEAAAIPVPMLKALLTRYSRIAFATTVHGYEGSGRGFELRFVPFLDQQTPQWLLLELNTPIRWSDNDPLENWLFDTMLLSAKVPEAGDIPASFIADNCTVREISQQQLSDDEQILSDIFALLVQAHYQTTPTDLRFLLDSPGLRVWCIYHQTSFVGVALAVEEGGIDASMAEQIYQAERRPRGHLIAQSLSVHGGYAEFPTLRGLRIMRIAVHPAWQRRGVGTALLQQLHKRFIEKNYDWWGSSFGATLETLAFWQKAGMQTARLGVSRDASSGTHSAILLQGLSETGKALVSQAAVGFQKQLPGLLRELFTDLEAELVQQLFLGRNRTLCQQVTDLIDPFDLKALEAFSKGQRQLESCLIPLQQLIIHWLGSGKAKSIEPAVLALAIGKLLQGKAWGELAKTTNHSGKKAMLSELQTMTGLLLKEIVE